MICISGIPGSGKTTLCEVLRQAGTDCIHVLDIPGSTQCLEGDEVDLQCLREKAEVMANSGVIIEGHYSHLLQCNAVIILERDEEYIRKELENRGYSSEKIEENVDALRSDVIYQEALEKLPSTRILRIKVSEGQPDIVLNMALQFIMQQKNKS